MSIHSIAVFQIVLIVVQERSDFSSSLVIIDKDGRVGVSRSAVTFPSHNHFASIRVSDRTRCCDDILFSYQSMMIVRGTCVLRSVGVRRHGGPGHGGQQVDRIKAITLAAPAQAAIGGDSMGSLHMFRPPSFRRL